ncbi:MAG: hypothetical protein QXQ64_00590 [Candidatus Bathyarchaeia archaeon]
MHASKKLIALPLLFAIALSIAGFAYATWSDKIYINGRIEMCGFSVGFDYAETPSPVEKYWDKTLKQWMPGEAEGKDVGKVAAYYDPESLYIDKHTGKQGYKKMIVELTNAYPCYAAFVTFKINNTGQLAVDVTGYTVSDPTGTLTFTYNAASGWWEGRDADGKLVLTVRVVNNIPFQLDACHAEKMEIDIHVEQNALECHTYKFSVTINYEQYDP